MHLVAMIGDIVALRRVVTEDTNVRGTKERRQLHRVFEIVEVLAVVLVDPNLPDRRADARNCQAAVIEHPLEFPALIIRELHHACAPCAAKLHILHIVRLQRRRLHGRVGIDLIRKGTDTGH